MRIMKRLILILSSLLFFACGTRVEEGISLNKESNVENDTNRLDNGAMIETDTTIISNESSGITALPFGPRIKDINDLCKGSMFYYDLIGEEYSFKDTPSPQKYTDTYKLPPIEKYIYTIVDTLYERSSCEGNILVDSLISIDSYKIRLPDLGRFEIYYMSNDAEVFDDFSEKYKSFCENFFYQFYGVLILYEKETKIARLLPIFYETSKESWHARYFYITEEYKILLCNRNASEGDPVDITVGPAYEIIIQDDGKFLIKNIFDERSYK